MNKTRNCFLHVPKAGGSSVIASLQGALGAGQVIHANESRYQHLPLPMLLERYALVAGHFTFAQIPDAVRADTFLFTFLRDPIDRALSHYYYYREQPPRADHDRRIALARSLDLTAFLDEVPERPSPWSNWQTFIFSGAQHAETAAEELLPAALRNLEQVDFIGVHEAFDEGLWQLGAQRGWPIPRTAPRVNVTVGRPGRRDIDDAALARLRALNACDAALYARARELWLEAKRNGGRRTIVAAPAPTTPADPTARVEHGTREITITEVRVRREAASAAADRGTERAVIDVCGLSHLSADDVTIGIRITDALGAEVYGVNTLLLGVPVAVHPGQRFELTFSFDQVLAPGRYYLTVAVHAADDHLHKCYHWIDNAVAIDWETTGPRTFAGLVDLRARARLSMGASTTDTATGG